MPKFPMHVYITFDQDNDGSFFMLAHKSVQDGAPEVNGGYRQLAVYKLQKIERVKSEVVNERGRLITRMP